jgi:hypothetical protein
MKFLLSIFFLLFTANIQATSSDSATIVSMDKIGLTRGDHIAGEHIINIMKLTEKGYVSQDVLSKIIIETSRSQHFAMFVPWLQSIHTISKITEHKELINYCRKYVTRKETHSLERVLERIAGNYCRERALHAINRDIQKNKR